MRACACVCLRAGVTAQGNLLSSDNVTMMWMATETRKEGFKQEIFRGECTENLYLKPRSIVALLLVLRPGKEKHGGR